MRLIMLCALLLATVVCPKLEAQTAAPDAVTQRFIDRAKDRLGDRLATSAEQVIERHLEASGGREAVAAIETVKYEGRNIILSTETRPLIRYLEKSGRLYQTSPGSPSYLMSDGEQVYSVNGAEKSVIDRPWAGALTHMRADGYFLDDGATGIAYEFLGLEAFRTEPTVFYHLKRTFADGYFEDLYFDVDSGLLRMIRENGDETKRRALYEYREVAGVLFPHLRLTIFAGPEPPHVFVTDSITVNGPIPDEYSE